MSETVIIKDKALNQLIKAFKGKTPVVSVGIMGTDGTKLKITGDGFAHGALASTVAEVGAAHEFGTSKLPRRSFLRMPLTKNLHRFLNKAGAFDPAKLQEVVESGTLVPWMKKIAITAEQVIQAAFDTGGFGEWIPSDITKKKNPQTLVETQQLRRSITSVVK